METPLDEWTEKAYEWAMTHVTKEDIEASLASGHGRPFREIIDELRSKYGEPSDV